MFLTTWMFVSLVNGSAQARRIAFSQDPPQLA